MYESACGIGLNLYMTLETIREDAGISGITVYGNEYVPVSVDKARSVVLADGVIPDGNRQGIVCPGDSTDLGHVPSDAFDVVYTGYVTPVIDVLHLHGDDPDWDDYTEYEDICVAFMRFTGNPGYELDWDDDDRDRDAVTDDDAAEPPPKQRPKKHDWMGNYLWELSIQRQRDWYGKWVGEMARIAKPGAPVIVEQVSMPYCMYMSDWGGVAKEFWYDAARENNYGWNIDPDSIEMMDDTIHTLRYHVFMLKNK